MVYVAQRYAIFKKIEAGTERYLLKPGIITTLAPNDG